MLSSELGRLQATAYDQGLDVKIDWMLSIRCSDRSEGHLVAKAQAARLAEDGSESAEATSQTDSFRDRSGNLPRATTEVWRGASTKSERPNLTARRACKPTTYSN